MPDGMASFRRAVRSEWTKVRTVPSTGWLLVAAVAAFITVGAAATAAVDTSHCPTPSSCYEDTTKLSLTGVWLAQALFAVFAVLAVTNEYGTGMARTTLVALPRRRLVLSARTTVVAGLTLAAAAIGVAGSLQAGRMILPGNGFSAANGYPPLSLFDGPTLRAATGTVLYLGLVTLLSLGVAVVLRDSAAAITTVFGLLYAFPVVTTLVSDADWQERLKQYGPSEAGLSIQATVGLDRLPIAPWTGLGVLAAYATAALLAGSFAFSIRDA